MNVIELFRKGADACAKVNVRSGTAYISVRDISAIVECGDEVEIHVRSGTIFTMTEPPEKSHSRSQPRVTIDDYHKKGHLYITVYFPDGEQYVGIVEKWEGEEE